MAKLDDRLAGLATMSLAELRQEWQRAAGSEAPRLGADLLRHTVAHRLQERALGGLPAADRRMLRTVGERLKSGSAPQLKAGTRLLRSWRGRNVSVEVTVAATCSRIEASPRSAPSPARSPAPAGRDHASSD